MLVEGVAGLGDAVGHNRKITFAPKYLCLTVFPFVLSSLGAACVLFRCLCCTEDAEAMDFDGFLRMLRVGSVDSLDQYDARWDRTGSFGSSLDRLQSLLDASHHGSDNDSTHGRGSKGLYAGMAPPAAVAAAETYSDKSWHKPMVNFKFDFGTEFKSNKAAGAGALNPASQGPPETQGAPAAEAAAVAATAAAAAAPEPKQASNIVTASSYFNNGAVRGGTHFDKRMHGASLYRNAVVGSGRPNVQAHALPTVRE